MFPSWPKVLCVAAVGVALTISTTMHLPVSAQESQGVSTMQEPRRTSSGYAEAAEGLGIYYEVYGDGEPIVVIAGGLMPIATTAQITGPLSKTRQVIAIDLEGHGRTGLRDTPMTHERNGDDVAAVLGHLGIDEADIAGYSHGADAAIWTAIQHPALVRNLIVIATGFSRDGWYPEAQEGMSAVGASLAEAMKATPLFEGYGHPEQFPLFLDRMGELMREDWDWSEEIRALGMPALLIFADHDSVSMQHIGEFFALFGGGVSEPGWIEPQFSRARLAIIPGYSHYNLGQAPEVAEVIERFLTQPTSPATQFEPE
jgi:pimeloyl-ACP methyl ester carboxylesterase